MPRIPMINGDEVDALCRPGRKWLKHYHGSRPKTKRRYRRRERRQGRRETLQQLIEYREG